MAKTIKRDSLAKQVSDELEAMIERGEYEVGDKIPTEPDLMEMFHVSRNTIREAIQGLTFAGILETKQGNGTFVQSNNRFQANMSQKYAEVSIEDIREARNSIEVTIAHLAAVRYEDEDFDLITEAFNRRQNQNTSTKENTSADLDFHMAIAYACHNTILIDLYKSILSYLESQILERKLVTKLTAEEIDRMHQNLYEAVISRSPDQAVVAAQDIVNI